MGRVDSVYKEDTQQQNIYCYVKDFFYKSSKLDSLSDLNNKTCALVSTSGALLAHENGAEIDAHDAVLRFHNAPYQTWAKNVGSRSDYGDMLKYFDSMDEIQGKVKRFFAELYPGRKGMHEVHPLGRNDPTSGTKAVLLALANCKEVDAYEMTPSKDAHKFPYHYYDVPEGKTNISADDNDWHGMIKAEH